MKQKPSRIGYGKAVTMLKAKHHWLIDPFFRWYTQRLIRKHFHRVEFWGTFEDRGLPVLLLSHHQSWWDGFWAMAFNQQILKRKLHFMMLEEQLRRYWYFNYAGGFSINKHSREVIESLNYAAELLKNPEHLVLMFPQGKIHSLYCREIHFQRGVERILERANHPVHVLFLVNRIDYGAYPRPSVAMYYREFTGNNYRRETLQHAYNEFYLDTLHQQQKLEI